MKNSKVKTTRPLLEIKKPLRARVYRAKFRALETTKFLDAKALKAAKKVTIEVGTLEIAGMTQAIAADIRNGMVVALKPVACQGCDGKGATQKRKQIGKAAFKKTIQLVAAALKDGGISTVPMPMPLKLSRRFGFRIPIGPIIIVIGDPDGGFDFCIEIWIGNELCWWCLFGANGCIDFGPPF